jgi:hypothetical protein
VPPPMPPSTNIAQPRAVPDTVPEASRLQTGDNKSGGTSIAVSVNSSAGASTSGTPATHSSGSGPHLTKGGARIVFDPAPETPNDDDVELSMEEKRAKEKRYQRTLRDVM